MGSPAPKENSWEIDDWLLRGASFFGELTPVKVRQKLDRLILKSGIFDRDIEIKRLAKMLAAVVHQNN